MFAFIWHRSHSCYTQRSAPAVGGTAHETTGIGAFAEQAHPRIGFLHQGDLPTPALIVAFRAGLEGGVSSEIEIEHRSADGDYNRLPALAADLVNRQVSVIAAELLPAGLAARAATKTIPVFQLFS